jgi:SAM-dependent methyltransferase
VDIGCGNGEFLSLLCERADNTGIGYDPSYEPAPEDEERPFTVVQDHYSEKYADHPADFICCRHVLEHVPDPLDFARTIRRAIGDWSDTTVYVEVPNALFTLREVALWDLIYEHYSYFTPPPLKHLFRRAGFEVIRVGEAFDGQYLQIELRPGEPEDASKLERNLDPARVTEAVDRFTDRSQEKRERWSDLFAEVDSQNQKAVLWGAGSKGVTILNLIPEAADATEYVVDINPRKQGKHVAGAGHRIVPPSFLREYQPDLVVLMNGVYEDEIRQTTRELGLDPEFAVAT